MRADLERWGYRVAETTRAMGMALDDLDAARPDIELGPPDWDEYLRLVGVAPDFLRDADRSAFHIVVARLDGEGVATGMAYDAADDCGIYNVGTVEHARRRGLATALTHSSCTTRATAGGARRRSNRPRWPSACTPRSGSATSARSSSTRRPARPHPISGCSRRSARRSRSRAA